MSSSSDRHRPTKGPITSHSFNAPHGIEIKADTVRKERAKYRIQREVAAMKYVQKHTSIPVPHVLDVQLDKDEDVGWFVMEKMSGVQLDSAWNKMDKAAQARTISQLKSYFAELHALRPPTMSSGRIGSHSGGPAYDHRFDNMATCGPFASVKDFHDMLVAPLGKIRPDWVSKYRKRLPDTDDIVFAHADISGENILIDPATGHVTGILDWEMAGFWPRWWEYRKGMFGSRCEIWWMNILKQVMVVSECYEDATEADMDLELFV